MHGFEEAGPAKPDDPNDRRPWYQLLTRYHWFVLVVAALGWLFDCLDQQLFILARPAAMKDLVKAPATPGPTDPETKPDAPRTLGQKIIRAITNADPGDIATAVFVAGWATGGLVFGMLGDRIGRAKTMLITILIYSLCTGLSALSVTVYDFAFYRFLTGLGVGGEFAVGVALVAEVMPTRARPFALSLLQALSAFGNISAAFINMGLGLAEGEGFVQSPWRIMFLIGALPALLALVIRRSLKEPEQWQTASHAKAGVVEKQLGSYAELFSDAKWRKHAILGLMLAMSGVVGLWAIGFYTPDLYRSVLSVQVPQRVFASQIAAAEASKDEARVAQLKQLQVILDKKEAVPEELTKLAKEVEKQRKGAVTFWTSMPSIALNVGAFFGMFGFGIVANKIGRKPTFVIALIAAAASTVVTFYLLSELWHVFVLVPIMGFCQLSLFSGYAIYFPELFPTRLRSTGISFCYNVGRFGAAFMLLVKSVITSEMFGHLPETERFRWAGISMCVVFGLGLLALPFLPETKDKQLPE